jgi:hypothetical protein
MLPHSVCPDIRARRRYRVLQSRVGVLVEELRAVAPEDRRCPSRRDFAGDCSRDPVALVACVCSWLSPVVDWKAREN